MIGLSDLANSQTDSWTAAQEAFDFPAVAKYNIAADCLSADRQKIALIEINESSRRELTFDQLNAQSAAFAAGLSGLGVQPGDRVAIKLSQSAQMAIAVLAVLRIGGIVTPISNVLGEDALRHRFEDSAPRVIISAGSAAELALTADVGAIAVTTAESTSERTMQQLIESSSLDSPGFAATGPDTPALLLFTSGTTGNSKGVLHGHRVLLGHHAIDLALDHIRDDDVAYSPVDWAWAGGLLLGLLVPLARGLTVVAYRDTHFSAERTIDVLRSTGVSVGLFPPTALRMLRRSGQLTKAALATLRLRSLVLGAEAVEPELTDWARGELGISVNNAYGQTEANSLIGHASVLGDLDRDCLGRAYPGHTIAILDAQLNECAVGETGEIAVRADDPVCMLRYWNAPDATAKKIRRGWLLTGDAAHADADHQIYFHGRTDDIIKSGGYRIGPTEIEAAIISNPAVVECAAIGIPDPVRGQAVAAIVTLGSDVADTEALTKQLQEQVRARVGAYAYPRTVSYVDSLPRTTAGKVDRKTLRHEFAQQLPPKADR